jgi:hypothetical protein
VHWGPKLAYTLFATYVMPTHFRVYAFLSFVMTFGISARAQVLSYSTYVPQNAGPSIAVNGAGDTCAAFINAPPFTTPSVSGAKFKNDGSTIYTISTLPGPTLVEAVDAAGNCYFAGQGQITPSPGVFQSTPKSSTSMYVEKFDLSGNLVFATYLGGSGTDSPAGMAVDSSGNVYLTGATNSNDFPTLNAHQPAPASPSDIFISVLNSTGTNLIYSTYWGGNNQDSGAAIAVDSAHNAYVTGLTLSTDFPVVSPFQATPGGAFVIKLSSTGVPVYSTYLGPPNGLPPPQTQGKGIAADSAGSAYVVGGAGVGFPLKNPIGPTPIGAAGFVTKFSPDGSALVYSSYIDVGTAIAVDQSGQAYITGGPTIPLVSPIQSSPDPANPSSTNVSLLISILNSSGTGLIFSTYLGQGAFATSIGTDSVPNIYVSGTVGNATCCDLFPILNASNGTYFAFDRDGAGVPQGFLSKISLSPGTSLSHPDAVDFKQEILSVGQQGFGEVLVANTSAVGNISINGIVISQGDFTQTNNCPPMLQAAAACVVNVTFVPTAGGTRTGTITISDSAPGSPHIVNLTGTGHAPIAVVSPMSLTFAGQAVGTSSAAQQVTVTNTGTTTLTISHIVITGDFSEMNSCAGIDPNPPNPNPTCPISIVFSPTALGNRAGMLTITDNAPGSPHTVSLSGQGVSPNLGLGVPAGDSSTATVSAGSPATYTLSIGGGGISGTASLTCTGAPKGSTCMVPSALNLSGTAASNFNVTVSTTSRTMALLRHMQLGFFSAVFFLGLLTAKKTPQRYLPLCAIAMLALLLSSCGGGQSGPQPNPNGTPAGTYQLTVSATVGSSTQGTGLTLTVQ